MTEISDMKKLGEEYVARYPAVSRHLLMDVWYAGVMAGIKLAKNIYRPESEK